MSRMRMQGTTIAAIAAFVVVGLGIWWVATSGLLMRAGGELDSQVAPSSDQIISYNCADDATITAGYGDRMVTVTLPDGRAFTLEQTVSASGARYANEGDQVVFWNKGTTAFMEENGEMSYTECVEEGSDAPIEID